MEWVSEVLDYLKDSLVNDIFYDLFKYILTDNGNEFSNSEHIEDNGPDILKTHVFYCDPKQSQQKCKNRDITSYERKLFNERVKILKQEISNFENEISDLEDNKESINK